MQDKYSNHSIMITSMIFLNKKESYKRVYNGCIENRDLYISDQEDSR